MVIKLEGFFLRLPSLYKFGKDFLDIRSVPKFTANLYCICLSIYLRSTQADAVKICGVNFGTLSTLCCYHIPNKST